MRDAKELILGVGMERLSLAELRLRVLPHIQHTDEYYQTALKSQGVDPAKLTHGEIAVWESSLKIVEADTLIALCLTQDSELFETTREGSGSVCTLAEKLTQGLCKMRAEALTGEK